MEWEVGQLFQFVVEIFNAIKTGIQIGNALADNDIGSSALQLISNVHFAAWGDILANSELNNGQYSMALMCQDAGADYIDSLGAPTEFDPEVYRSYCYSAAEGAAEGLSQVVTLAEVTIGHAVNSAAVGVSNYFQAYNLEEGFE
jgi:hypothetical protein